MSRTVDERVVEMQFDNRDFERNVSTTMSTLEKFKRSLNLSGAAKGLTDVGEAARGVRMDGLGSSIDTVRAKFSALQVIGVTALANLTNSAVNAGKRIASALTIEPVFSGFQEYETQINAVQTILANTSSKGTTLEQVNKALDTLNTYADKTIYNFTEMTRNIGTFTAAGVDLDTSVTAIQGIANLAAVSGSTSQQASTAMYQLSQALAAGTVKLMDWNSVVNAGMGGQVFQDALKETARAHGIAIDKMIKDEGSFRETLSKGWLSSEILTETLAKFTMTTEGLTEAQIKQNREMLKSKGYTDKQIDEIFKLGETATNAATKVKTFTQLWDTLKEAAQSGWTQSWEIIVGDFEEAKSLLTSISDTVGAMIGKSAEARNSVLQGWKDAGGRGQLIEGFKNSFEGILSIVKPIKEAFAEVFPPVTSKTLLKLTEGFRDLTAKLKLSSETADKVKRAFKGAFSILDIGRKVIVTIGNSIAKLLGSNGVSSLGDFLLDSAASIGDFFTSLNEGFDTGGLSGMLSKMVSSISDLLGGAANHLRGFGDVFSFAGETVEKVAEKIWKAVKTVFGWITDNVSAGDIFAGLAGGGIFVAAKKLSSFLDKILDKIKGIFGGDKGEGVKDKFADILGSVHDSLESFATGIKVSSIVSIAIAIGILSASLKTISKLDVGDIAKSLTAIGTMLGMLSWTMRSMVKTLTSFGSRGKGLISGSVSLIFVAKAIDVLAKVMTKLSNLSLADISKGLIAIGVGITELSFGLRAISKTKVSLKTSVAILALAEGCKILADAVKKFSDMHWGEIGRGLTAMGGALAELVIAVSALSKFSGGKSLLGSTSVLILVQSLGKMADGLSKFAGMSWDEIKRGLSGMGGALTELTVSIGVLGKIGGFSSLLGSGAISIVIQSLEELAEALQTFGFMTWDEIKHGLVGMGGALVEVAGVTGALGKIAGFSGILGSGAILIVVQSLSKLADSLQKFGFMTWDEITRGLVGMGGALTEVAGISGTLGRLAGLSGILGAGSILLGAQSLGDLADALKKFGGLTWDEIKRGLVGMGGALTEISVISGTLGKLAPLSGLLGGGAILLGVQGLGDLADALKKFGEMSWEEIGHGLTAMGAALGEIALGGLLNTLSGFGALAITEVSESLGILADSVKKWAGVTVPENLGAQLSSLAIGIGQFTFDGWGAEALSTAAPAIGTMADSVRKWTGVVVPENLGTQLGYLADGIKAFTFGGWGADAISTAAPAIGTMADSVKKWASVSIPENLESGLKQIANGVKAFSFAFMGGWSISAIAGPLGSLPDAVKKWNGVSLPENLEKSLKSLANGVKAFSFAFVGGWSLSAVTGPLNDLASSVKKWNGVKVPDGLEKGLKSLAAGVKAFSLAFVGGWSLSTIAGPLGTLATSVKKWNGTSIPEGLGGKLKSLATGVKAFSGIGDISYTASNVKSIASSIKLLSGVNFKSTGSEMTSLVNSIKKLSSIGSVNKSLVEFGGNFVKNLIGPIKKASGQFTNVGSDITKSIAKGIQAGQSAITTRISSIMKNATQAVNKHKSTFNSAGKALMAALSSGITSKGSSVVSSINSAVKKGASGIKGNYSSFYSAGSYLAEGFANGIQSGSFKAQAKAVAMAKSALKAAKDALGIASPSKEAYKLGDFYGLGFVNALDTYVDKAYNVSSKIGDYTRDGLSNAISNIQNAFDGNTNTQPTIRPVLDLTDIENGAGSIDEILSKGRSIGVNSGISTVSKMMDDRGQNGIASDVISAISDLRKELSKLERPSYNVNGVTYDDGSNVADAVRTLVRAAKIERRV